MYQPDGIEAGIIGGQDILFTANEGDARDYPPCFTEEDRVSTSNLNPAEFPESESSTLLKLRVTNTRGKTGGVYDELYTFGGRSFSIWDASGEMVYDSGKLIEDRWPPFPTTSTMDAATTKVPSQKTWPLVASAAGPTSSSVSSGRTG